MDPVVQLKEHRLTTTDLDEAREILTRQYCSHRIFQKDQSAALDVRYSHSSLLNMSFNYLQYGAEVDIRPREFETFYLVHIPLAGRAYIRAAGHHFYLKPGAAAIVSPTHHVSTTWKADCKQLMLKVDRKALESLLSHLLYQPVERVLEFPILFDLTAGLGASFYGMIQHLVTELANNDAVVKSRLVCSQLEQTLLTLILFGADHSYREALQATDKPVCPKHVVKAYHYMVANARESITIADLTELTGVSGRALYEGFKRFKGASPKACLRAIRMQAARKELLEGGDSDDVTMVAQRWGFTHLGRFASNYQKIFGEKPSQTLRRRR
jgi:AraC-like DNA-binding protein